MTQPCTIDRAFWRQRKVLLTGHTGFKGSWLSLWLASLGAEVRGFALAPPTEPALFREARVAEVVDSHLGDIRDFDALRREVLAFRPEVVIHMAAQPLVRLSYEQPLETYATNVMGTAHVLEAVRQAGSVRAVVNVTTDKCYENREWVWGYREDEPMGGFDPYSSSKGCAELVTSAYRRSFFGQGAAVASARAGNVIGGGDWARDRLIPDILRAFDDARPVVIRNPAAVRPWQHVLEPLSGYLVLAQRLASDDGHAFAEGWNFGPRDDDAKPVQWIVERLVDRWGSGASWRLDDSPNPHEAHYLKLDVSKARARLGWQPRWTLGDALDAITHWHRQWRQGGDIRAVCLEQIQQFTQSMESASA